MSIDNVNIFKSLEQSKIKNNKKNNYDDDDYVNMGNTDFSTIKPKNENESITNEKNKETNINDNNDHIIKNSNRDFFNDDFFGLSIDLKKKENNQIVKIENKELNEDLKNNIDNVKISYYSRPSSSEEEDNININEEQNKNNYEEEYNNYNEDENNNYNIEENNENEEKIDENYNPLEDNEEDNFKIDISIGNKNKKNYLQSDKSINASEINFNFSNSNNIIKNSKNIKKSNISNNKNSINSNSLLEYSQSYNFNQPKKAKLTPLTNNNLKVSKNPLPNQSITSSIRTTINGNINDNSVYKFLKEIKMEKYYNNLTSNGFDDIQLIIEQCKNEKKGITDDNLKKAGIELPGDRAKIFIRIQDKAKNFNFKIPDSIYHICNNLNNIEKDDYIKKLNNWLTQLKLQEYLIKFISSGYHSVELIYAQMISKFPLNEDILEEIGIKLLGHKKKLMIKLEDEIKNIPSLFNKYNKSKNVNFEKGNEKNCDCKLF